MLEKSSCLDLEDLHKKNWQKLLTDKSQHCSFIFWELWETFVSTQKVKNNECIAVTQKKNANNGNSSPAP